MSSQKDESNDIVRMINQLKNIKSKKNEEQNTTFEMDITSDNTISPLDIVSNIKNLDDLISALEELNNMVEMMESKSAVVAQLKFLMINRDPGGKHMLNAVISGPPGTGKTKLATILAKIWTIMNLVKKRELDVPKPIPVAITNFVYERTINKLESEMKEVQNKMDSINQISQGQKDSLNKLKKQMNRLRDNLRFISPRQETFIQGVIDEIEKDLNTIGKMSVTPPDANRTTILPADIPQIRKQTVVNIHKDDSPITIVSREHFVAQYLGQTAIKTLKLLEENRGKVLFIDEAYSLFNGNVDQYGMEALTTLNKFMSEHPDEIIVIFAGYKQLLEKTIFKAQPGLTRRIFWTFNIEKYTPKGLAEIFKCQLKDFGWTLDPNINIESFFSCYKDNFSNFGGDTERLTYHCMLSYSDIKFEEVMSDKTMNPDKIITQKMLDTAYKHYIMNDTDKNKEPVYKTMYS